MSNATTISAAQMAMLARLANNGRGWETPPDGNRAAGRAAANWYRTADCLHRMGLIVRTRGTGCTATITQAGHDALTGAAADARAAADPRPACPVVPLRRPS